MNISEKNAELIFELADSLDWSRAVGREGGLAGWVAAGSGGASSSHSRVRPAMADLRAGDADACQKHGRKHEWISSCGSDFAADDSG